MKGGAIMKNLKHLALFVFYLGALVSIAGFASAFVLFTLAKVQENNLIKDQLRIQKESHILGIYSAYKNNMDSCRAEATKKKKDEEFIKATCIEAINGSMLGESLKSWGKADLLTTN